MSRAIRRQLCGTAEVEAALDAGEPLRLLLVHADRIGTLEALCEAARARGAAVHPTSEAMLWRLAKRSPTPDVLGLVGPDPAAPRDAVLAAGGACWLLVGNKYPGNAGFAIRSAEVSGADGIFVDNDMGHDARREAIRASMRADRYFPVFWEPAAPLLADARAAGRRIVAIEDVGTHAPWESDLRGPILLVVGGEREGIPEAVIRECDEVLRLPMPGFIPSYNLQAAMAMVMGERLRQLENEPKLGA
ncbi:MAG: TrmH family RNA methyltransferase [Myxococcota bacterium]|nr:TrmH family RNA methyltransferase [Myxococcota bacterium]